MLIRSCVVADSSGGSLALPPTLPPTSPIRRGKASVRRPTGAKERTMATRKRRNGEGTFYKDSQRNRWVGQVTLTDGAGRKVRKKVTGRTQREVADKARELQAAHEAGAHSLDRSITVEAFASYWLGEVLPYRDLAESTRGSYAYVCNRWVIPTWGHWRLCDLQRHAVEKGLASLVEKGLRKGTVKQVKSVLSSLFEEAVREMRVSHNVTRGVRMPKVGVARVRRAMSFEQTTALIESTVGGRAHGPIVIGLTTGLRIGEILSLRWEDVDLEADEPTLRVVESKTDAGRRTVTLTTYAARVLSEQRRYNIRTARSTCGMWSDEGFVFPSVTGTKWNYANFLKIFHDACEEAGIGRDWVPHEMRHTAASFLFSEGVRVTAVTEQLGHSTISTTYDLYGHQIKRAEEVRQAFEKLVPRGGARASSE